ncbi:hypothetical protein [Actinoplanes sp. URMC 104]|uniref:hypothetical protein n=1 Tax=Actinoplanes sp. URMC 104 TaxID=3423409 RepID=UPI003F19C8F6
MRVPHPDAPPWTVLARELARGGGTPAEILGAVRDRQPAGLPESLLVVGLVTGYGVPIRIAMDTIRWQGLGVAGGLTDDELNGLLAPYF